MSGSVITGWGTALPEKVVTNAEFEARLDTTDTWIVERTGIRERRFGGTTSSLAVEAGAAAITRAGLSPS
ncbi:MAG: 3-oxoacyl-ACP synthase, partial [Acidimicrobiales bacterium]